MAKKKKAKKAKKRR